MRQIDSPVYPGVYDVIYRRGGTDSFSSSDPDDNYPFANTILETVVLGPGTNRLDVDIPSATLSGAITLDGGAHWVKLSGLPTIAVRDIDIQRRENDLVMAPGPARRAAALMTWP